MTIRNVKTGTSRHTSQFIGPRNRTYYVQMLRMEGRKSPPPCLSDRLPSVTSYTILYFAFVST